MAEIAEGEAVENLTDYLKSIVLFQTLDDSALEIVAQNTDIRKYLKDEILFSAGDNSYDVFYVFEGSLGVKYFSESGREISYTTVSAGSFLGEFSAIDCLPRSATVISETNTVLGVMDSKSFKTITSKLSEVSIILTEKLIEKNRRLVNRIFEHGTMTVQQRVCREILRIHRQREVSEMQQETIISDFPTHYQLASMIGSHREAVSREMSSLEKAGILVSGRRKLEIKRYDLLKVFGGIEDV